MTQNEIKEEGLVKFMPFFLMMDGQFNTGKHNYQTLLFHNYTEILNAHVNILHATPPAHYVAIPSGGAGVLIGGLIIFFMKSRGRSVALINWVVTLIALLPTLVFIVYCPTLELVGVTVEYPDG